MITEDFEYTKKVLLNIEKIFNNYVSIRNYALNTCVECDKQTGIISLNISLVRDSKQFAFRFLKISDYANIKDNVQYIAMISLKNEAEEMIWYRDISPLYHLEVTGRNKLLKLFPEPYVAKQGEVDEAKIYDYVHKYLSALKVMLSEPDFQKLLNDPEYWIQESPYK